MESDFLNVFNKIPPKWLGRIAGAAIAPVLVQQAVGDQALLKTLSIPAGFLLGGDVVQNWDLLNKPSAINTFTKEVPKEDMMQNNSALQNFISDKDLIANMKWGI